MLPNADMTGLSAVNEFAQFQKHRHLKAVLPLMARRQQNSVIKINYPGSGNNSQFGYDGMSLNVKITETVGGAISSIKQFVWAEKALTESRDATGLVLSKYFSAGQTISGTSYVNTYDHLGSVREFVDLSGAVQAVYSYDAMGRVTSRSGPVTSDYQYAQSYFHSPSNLNLMRHRAYISANERWLNRDPIAEKGGVNQYRYASNDPLSFVDPSGTNTAVIIIGAGEVIIIGAIIVVIGLNGSQIAQMIGGAGGVGGNAGAGAGSGAMNFCPNPCQPGRAQFHNINECYNSCDQNCKDPAANISCKLWCILGRPGDPPIGGKGGGLKPGPDNPLPGFGSSGPFKGW